MSLLPLRAGSSKLLISVLVALTTLTAGLIDYIAGADVYVTSLYFVPLAIAGWRFGRTGAISTAFLTTIVWFLALYLANIHYAPYVWLANTLTQITSFLAVAILVAMLSDALKRERDLSRTDALTGLNNRRGFTDYATAALSLCRRHHRPVALAYIDLNKFKQINDTLGHARGDALLTACGRLIGEFSRESDIAARLGGDEFAVFLPETNAENALALLERIRDGLISSEQGRETGVTASIGLVVDDAAISELNELLHVADVQMYAVKNGRLPRHQVSVSRIETA